jgi:predicted DNA binding CopG/RHH family protein
MSSDKRKPGRPALPDGAGKTARVDLRVLPAEKAAWQAKAAAAGLTLQAWIERALGRAK